MLKKDFMRSVVDTRGRLGEGKRPCIPAYSYRGQDEKLPSLETSVGNATAKAPMVYTGTKMIGIAQMHKSNAVPVFSQEEAVDISKMRR